MSIPKTVSVTELMAEFGHSHDYWYNKAKSGAISAAKGIGIRGGYVFIYADAVRYEREHRKVCTDLPIITEYEEPKGEEMEEQDTLIKWARKEGTQSHSGCIPECSINPDGRVQILKTALVMCPELLSVDKVGVGCADKRLYITWNQGRAEFPLVYHATHHVNRALHAKDFLRSEGMLPEYTTRYRAERDNETQSLVIDTLIITGITKARGER